MIYLEKNQKVLKKFKCKIESDTKKSIETNHRRLQNNINKNFTSKN